MNPKKIFQNYLPDEFKSKICNSSIKQSYDARKLAFTSKRLDLCSAQIAHALHVSNLPSIKNKICLEIGSGMVLSHSLVLYLLGAKNVIATDIQRIARPNIALHDAIHKSTISIIRDVLSPFEEHDIIRQRLNQLLTIKKFSFDILEDIGIKYVAPIDLTSQRLNTIVDFIYSNSVLEHVPIEDILPLLNNLAINLSDGGKMIHCVHLEDHKDIMEDPFAFLRESKEKFTRVVQSNRGNRIRRSGWEKILYQVKDMEFEFIYEWNRRDKRLPNIDESIDYIDNEDLIISHVGILGTKVKNKQ